MLNSGMSINREVKHAWLANYQVNKVLLDHLTSEMLSAKTPAGEFTVAHHLADMGNCPKYWGAKIGNKAIKALGNLYNETVEEFIPETDLEHIRSVFEETHKVILNELENNDGSGLVHRSIEMYMIHMLVHDAHHRGQILVTLKTAGHSIPDEEAVWMPWKS